MFIDKSKVVLLGRWFKTEIDTKNVIVQEKGVRVNPRVVSPSNAKKVAMKILVIKHMLKIIYHFFSIQSADVSSILIKL